MKGKLRFGKAKAKIDLLIVISCLIVFVVMVSANGNHNDIVGYTYDSGYTLWEMAERHCPNDMDIREFIREIKKANGMENSVVYANQFYKIPVYETETDIV